MALYMKSHNVDTVLSFIIMVDGTLASARRLLTLPVFTSSSVVPPSSGAKNLLLSPKSPWQEAHFEAQTSSPSATLPLPGFKPWKSGRTSMSQASTSTFSASLPTLWKVKFCSAIFLIVASICACSSGVDVKAEISIGWAMDNCAQDNENTTANVRTLFNVNIENLP